MRWEDLPREELERMTIIEAAEKGVDWEDCFPVCYGDDLMIDDVLDANGWLLWACAPARQLVIDDSYEYARPKAEEEEAESSGEADTEANG